MRWAPAALCDRVSSAALAGALLLATGCVPIPVYGSARSSRTNVSSKTIDEIVVGATTREEVLLELGEPDLMGLTDDRIVYRWEVVVGYLIPAVGPGNEIGRVSREHELEIIFDEAGVVKERTLRAHTESESR